jgi:peptidoglycan-associated lipoprotein
MTRRSNVAVLVVVALLPTLAGCAQQAPKTTTPSATAPKEPGATPSPQQPAVQEQRPASQGPSNSVAGAPPTSGLPQNLEEFTGEPALKDVFFEPGRADIGRNGATIMLGNARWLVDNRDFLVLIEGHTDYKGTREGNLAIAERRAKAAASFLTTMGVPDTRLWTVSYGSDRPVCVEKTDACAAKSRRVHFRVKRQ